MRTEAPTPNSTAQLWVIAREMLTMMILALESPGIVAAIERLTCKTKREIKDWLCPLETLTRKLLLIEAAKLPRPDGRRLAPHAERLAKKLWRHRRGAAHKARLIAKAPARGASAASPKMR
ncbi:MAG: hypothetical protein ABUL73_02015 [Alphaproteobacteria bacterium]